MTLSFHVRRLACVTLLLCFVYILVQAVRIHIFGIFVDDVDREARLFAISKSLQSSYGDAWRRLGAGGQACKHPELEVENPLIMAFIKETPPIDCGEMQDWVVINGSTAYITDEARSRYGEIQCLFTDIIRRSEESVHDGLTTQTHTEYNLEESDFIKVHCSNADGKTWHSTLAGIRHDRDVLDRAGWEKVPRTSLHMDVLIWGFDSLARNMFARKLPKTHNYLLEVLNAVELHGYNIVGDGTPQALIPILTGKTELELPETRKRMGDKAHHVNIYPFVWKTFQENGYVTAFLEDCPTVGTFTYRLKGFDNPPTDHYMRPFYVAASNEFSSFRKYCIGSIPRHKVMMNYVQNFFRVYRNMPKFMFAFHGELSHDSYNLIGAADDDMLHWLKSMREEGHLNNTLLIVMSDHGHRFADIRNTQQGKQEERMPMFAFVFPPWFHDAHPDLINTFKKNSRRLTTPFDINPTLEDIVTFHGTGKGDLHNRAISLFKEIPPERTCTDAYIEPHWCACLVWREVSMQDPAVIGAANALVDRINKYTEDHREFCPSLHVVSVQWAAKLLPTEGLLKFRRNADVDGFVADLTANTEVNEEFYQLKVLTQPGNGLFEASLRHNLADNTYIVHISDISRINRYGRAAYCVEKTAEHLRKFCYCRRQVVEQ